MSYKIIDGPHPQIKIHQITGELTYAAMTAESELGLLEGPKYVLLDVSELDVGLPAGFLEGAKHSYFTHLNLRHMALYTRSHLLSNVGKMVAKLTHKKNQLSVHTSYDHAINHLLSLVESDASVV